MKIKFNSLKLYNFLSIHQAEIILDNLGYVAITGQNNNQADSAISNGSGKSSIIESIVWCLTGETVRGTKDIVSNFAEDGSYVELCFDVEKDKYQILRSKDHCTYKTNLKIFINGEDKSGKGIRDSEKILKDYLPDITPELIGSVIVLGQGLPQRFSNNTPSARKEILEQLSKSDFMISDLKNRVSSRLNILNDKQREFEDKILSQDTTLELLKKQNTELNDKLNNLESIDNYQEELKDALTEKQKVELEISNDKTSLDNYNKEISNADTLILSIIDDIDKTKISLKEKYDEKISFEESMKTDIRHEITRLENEINTLSNIKDICPTCGQKIPGVIKPDVSSQVKKLEEKREELKRATEVVNNSRNASIEEYQNVITPMEERLKDERCKRELIVDSIKVINTNLPSEERHLDSINKRIAELEKSINHYNTLKETLETQYTKNNAQMTETSKEKEKYQGLKADIDMHIDIVKKMNLSLSKDFRGILLQNVITFINNKAKEYCQDVFDNSDIDFILNGNNIDIKYLNKDYENLSGGEKQKIDLIIQFALRDMLCKYLDFSCNIICLDEIFDNLDMTGCQKVIDFISHKLNDIASIFIITHHNDLQIPVDNEIHVVKDMYGVSSIQ